MQEDMILDFPGGGFVAMTPEHHEERLRMWAVRTGRPVVSVDYGKAPECRGFSIYASDSTEGLHRHHRPVSIRN